MFMFSQKLTRNFRQNEDGSLLVIVGMSLALFLGLVALSFDLGRTAITQTELQSFADSVALAAAGELDGNPDAISRASNAAAQVADTQIFGNGNNDLQGSADYTLTFLSALPDDDTAAVTAVTTQPRQAAFVQVSVADVTVDYGFAAAASALLGGQNVDATVSATAVAGYTQFSCDVTPLMFCAPSGFDAESSVGDMIQLRAGGQGAAWGPGNFGFLDPSTGASTVSGPCAGLKGNNEDKCFFGAINPINACFSSRGVDTLPGQRVGNAEAAMNVRFDIFESSIQSERTNPLYAPAPNVIKGLAAAPQGNGNGGGKSQCLPQNAPASVDTAPLPRDDCMGGACGRFGNGDWSAGRANYVATNYGGTDPHPDATTRWQYYLSEIAKSGGAGSGQSILPAGLSETGRPTCSSSQSNDPERRVVVGAAIDCNKNPVSGADKNVPVQEYVKLFLTEPLSNNGGGGSSIDIFVEVVGSAGGDGSGASNVDGAFRDVVQLYR